MRKIDEFKVTQHGINYPDYFQGHGISCTGWTDCATGIGNTPSEAAEDALDSLAQADWDVEALDISAHINKPGRTVEKEIGFLSEDAQWYISIDVKEVTP